MTVLSLIATIIGAVFTGGAGVAFINAVAARRKTRADVVDRLSDAQLKWVGEFQEESREARREASEARREVAEARRELHAVREEAEALAVQLRSIRMMIFSPHATVDGLRHMLGDHPTNGSGSR
jgi:chromosome segregation ATPase